MKKWKHLFCHKDFLRGGLREHGNKEFVFHAANLGLTPGLHIELPALKGAIPEL